MTQPSADPEPATSDAADDIGKHQIHRHTPENVTTDMPGAGAGAARIKQVQRELAKRRAIDRARKRSVDSGLNLDEAL